MLRFSVPLTNTYSMTAYHTVPSRWSKLPGIHSLVEDIKLFEIKLEIVLEVIHVPGTTIFEPWNLEHSASPAA
jgi:hypothetical protein